MILSEPLSCCLGLDIAKAKFDACLLIGSRVHHSQFDNSKAGIRSLLLWCKKLGALSPLTVLEATGRYSELACHELHAAGHPVHLANPRRIKDHARSLGRRNKTDRIDAALIAGFGCTRSLPRWQPAGPTQELLRDLLRRLNDIESMLQAERNRLAVCSKDVSKSVSRIIRTLEKEASSLDSQIKAHIKASPDLHADIERLSQVEGIGTRSARWLCAELPRHLPNPRAAAAWLAVTPCIRQSGTSVRSTAPVGSDGNRHLRKVLFMASIVARQKNPRLKIFADRLAASGKSKMTIIIAVLHKLIKIAFALLKNQSSYDPLHNPSSFQKIKMVS